MLHDYPSVSDDQGLSFLGNTDLAFRRYLLKLLSDQGPEGEAFNTGNNLHSWKVSVRTFGGFLCFQAEGGTSLLRRFAILDTPFFLFATVTRQHVYNALQAPEFTIRV